MSNSNVVKLVQPGTFSDHLTEVLRRGARSLLCHAIEAEVADFLVGHGELKTSDGRQRVVRHFEGFSAQYARAREIGYHAMFDEILEIADTPQGGETTKVGPNGTETRIGDMIEHRRLQVDARKWILSKALPKTFGDKLAVDQTTNVVRDTIDRPPRETREEWIERRRRELAMISDG